MFQNEIKFITRRKRKSVMRNGRVGKLWQLPVAHVKCNEM